MRCARRVGRSWTVHEPTLQVGMACAVMSDSQGLVRIGQDACCGLLVVSRVCVRFRHRVIDLLSLNR